MHIFGMYKGRKDEVGGLVRHLTKEMDCLWTSLQEEGIGPTNNHTERMLRFTVIWRKRNFGTRREKSERFVECILSVRKPAVSKKCIPIRWLQMPSKISSKGNAPIPLLSIPDTL
jgi:hypothetical protein